MLTEICQELKNWFDRGQPKYFGTFTVSNGIITGNGISLQEGQYFRIVGSVFNDGVHLFPTSHLVDEVFEGSVWAMAVPPAVIALANEIEEWQKKYGGVGSVLMSPYQSESFGGYSYSKSGGGSGDGTSLSGTWQGAFSSRLNRWRKI